MININSWLVISSSETIFYDLFILKIIKFQKLKLIIIYELQSFFSMQLSHVIVERNCMYLIESYRSIKSKTINNSDIFCIVSFRLSIQPGTMSALFIWWNIVQVYDVAITVNTSLICQTANVYNRGYWIIH